jgi:CRISPR/Cas system-associated exonuclease Cas4 (RecB family)
MAEHNIRLQIHTTQRERKTNFLGWNWDQLPIIPPRISNYRNKWQEHTRIVLNYV